MLWVRLTPEDMAFIRAKAADIVGRARARGARSTYGRLERPLPLDNYVIGFMGECAVSRFLGIPWDGGVYGSTDVGNAIEVRTRALPGYGRDMILMKTDRPKSEKFWVLCHVLRTHDKKDLMPWVRIRGWIHGIDGYRDTYFCDAPRYKPDGAWFVPWNEMNSFYSIPVELGKDR